MLRCVVSGLREDGVMGGGVGLADSLLGTEGVRTLVPALRDMPQLTHLVVGFEVERVLVSGEHHL